MKMNKIKIVLPILYNTEERPENVNDYAVWIPINNTEMCQIYINGRWSNFVEMVIEESNNNNEKIVSDKEYKLIEAIREFMREE